MAKISSYTTVTAAVDDKVIGTDHAGTPADGTKNFLVQDIAALAGTQGLVTLTQVLTANNTANNLNIVLTGTGSLNAVNSTLSGTLGVTGESTLSGNVVLGNTLTAGGGVGSSGQVLSSTGTGVAWATAAPVLTLTQKSGSYTAVDGDLVGCRTNNPAFTISPPPAVVGSRFGVADIANSANTNNITIDFNAQGVVWNNTATDLVMSKDSFCVIFEYVSGALGWVIVGGSIP